MYTYLNTHPKNILAFRFLINNSREENLVDFKIYTHIAPINYNPTNTAGC
jgi:hypothetical protein